MKKILPLVVLVLAGCSTGTHIVTGAYHLKIKPDQVVLYQVPPAKFEIVGIVNAATSGRSQRFMDYAIKELKTQAAAIGANGVFLGVVSPGSETVGEAGGSAFGGGQSFGLSSAVLSMTGIQLSGQAILVSGVAVVPADSDPTASTSNRK